jgi:RimJ/RimL family protein N-acetyltransferase
MYTVRALTAGDALQIVSWCYPSPYDIYNMVSSDDPAPSLSEAADSLLDPRHRFFAVDDESGTLLGYCCYGEEGQVPGYDYSQLEALDVGAGMHPDKIGQGRGRALMAAILAFGQFHFQPTHWRTTVASFNERSQRMCRNAGFVPVATFVSTTASPRQFTVMVRAEK